MTVFLAVAETADGPVQFYGVVRHGEETAETAEKLAEVVFGASSVRVVHTVKVKEKEKQCR